MPLNPTGDHVSSHVNLDRQKRVNSGHLFGIATTSGVCEGGGQSASASAQPVRCSVAALQGKGLTGSLEDLASDLARYLGAAGSNDFTALKESTSSRGAGAHEPGAQPPFEMGSLAALARSLSGCGLPPVSGRGEEYEGKGSGS